jgi:hypothetical protein
MTMHMLCDDMIEAEKVEDDCVPLARPGERADIITSRPITSWDTSVSTIPAPTNPINGSLSISRTSATMWPRS